MEVAFEEHFNSEEFAKLLAEAIDGSTTVQRFCELAREIDNRLHRLSFTASLRGTVEVVAMALKLKGACLPLADHDTAVVWTMHNTAQEYERPARGRFSTSTVLGYVRERATPLTSFRVSR